MDTLVKNGGFQPGPGGLPAAVTGLSELLNYAGLSLSVRQGMFPYDRGMGSRLYTLNRQEEHAADRALAMANEALMWLPGVSATEVEFGEGGMAFTVTTPLGEGSVVIGEL